MLRNINIPFDRVISISAIIVSLFALFIALAQYNLSKKQHIDSQTSNIAVRFDPLYSEKVKIEFIEQNNFDEYFYRKKSKIIFSNNGNKNASIVKWSFYIPIQLEKEDKVEMMRIYVPGINPKLISLTNKNKPIPLNISPGYSETVILEYSVGIPNHIAENIIKSYGSEINWQTIDSILNENKSPNSEVGRHELGDYMAEFTKGNGDSFSIYFSNFGTIPHVSGEF